MDKTATATTTATTATDTDTTTTATTDTYLSVISEKEKKAYEIAKSHLGSYFNLETSNGYFRFRSSS